MLQGLGPLPAGASATDPRGASDEGNRSKAEGNCGVSALAAGLGELGLTSDMSRKVGARQTPGKGGAKGRGPGSRGSGPQDTRCVPIAEGFQETTGHPLPAPVLLPAEPGPPAFTTSHTVSVQPGLCPPVRREMRVPITN